MGSYVSFEYLKHKLWPKKGSGVKVSIWLPTIKSRELPSFTCLHVACHISLEICWQEIIFFFSPHLNQMFAQKVIGLQSCRNPNFRNFETLDFGVPRQNDIWVQPSWLGTKNIIGGKVVASPKFELCRVLWVCVCVWLVHAPKMPQLHIHQLVVWFVQACVNSWPTCQSS